MPFSDEYHELKRAITANDIDMVKHIIQELKSTETKACEIEGADDFNELTTTLVALAVSRPKPEILQILLDYGLNPSREVNGKHPLHIAAMYNKFEHAAILLDYGVDVNSICSITSLTPLYVADLYSSQETKKILIQKGAKTAPLHPLDDKKISYKKLQELVSQHGEDLLKLSELLTKNNYSASLKGFILTPNFFERFKTINFSGMNLSYCVVQLAHADQIEFEDTNLSNAFIDIRNRPSILKFNNAIFNETTFLGEAQYRKNLTDLQYNKCNFLYLNVPERVKQSELISRHSNLNAVGVCFGLCVEYMRFSKKHHRNKSFIEKLKRKIDDPSENFVTRISFFHKHNLKLYVLNETEININDIKTYQGVEKIFNNTDAGYIGLSLEFSNKFEGHIVLLEQVKSSSPHYQIYDPNWGESPLLNEEQANKHFSALLKFYEMKNPGAIIKLSIEDFEKRYERTITHSGKSTKLRG